MRWDYLPKLGFKILVDLVIVYIPDQDPFPFLPALSALAGALGGDLEAVGVHGGHDVDARVVQQPPDVVVGLVVVNLSNQGGDSQVSAVR